VVESDTGVCSGERRAVNRDRESRRGVQAWFLLLAILAGTVVPIQGAVKSELRETVGRSITTAVISFLVGTFVLGAGCFWSVSKSVPAHHATEAP